MRRPSFVPRSRDGGEVIGDLDSYLAAGPLIDQSDREQRGGRLQGAAVRGAVGLLRGLHTEWYRASAES